jgi:site-specific DNA-methyltransferase (adenine-specific)
VSDLTVKDKTDKEEQNFLNKEKLVFEKQIVYFKSSEKMNEIEDNSIDVIITSPPYNRDKNYVSDDGKLYNDNKDEEEYLKFLKKVWKECLRVASDKAVFFLNIGDSANDQGKSEKVALSAENAGWKRIQDIIWVKSFLGKGHYTPSGGNKRLNNMWEHIYLFVKKKKKYQLDTKAIGIPYADKSNIGRYSDEDLRDPGNVWLIPYSKTTGATTKKGHDAPFPIGLPYKCIKLVPYAEKVLDPFGGTCSTLAACLKLGLEGRAYENYPNKNIIKSRIKEGIEFNEEKVNLIPHLELTIKILSKMLSSVHFTPKRIETKKDYRRFSIMDEILENLQIKNDFNTKLKKRIKNYKKNKHKQVAKNKIQKTLDDT